MACVPREDLIGARVHGASGDQRIVDGPAGNPAGGSLPNTGKIFVAFKTHKTEPVMDTFQKFDGLVRRSPMWEREPRKCGIDLSEAMRSAKRDIRVAPCVKPEARGVVGMFSQKHRNQNGRIEKKRQLESPRNACSRSRRMRSSVSSTTAISIGWPVRSTGTPSSRTNWADKDAAAPGSPAAAPARERIISLRSSSSDRPLA